jgi:hypothetical protein
MLARMIHPWCQPQARTSTGADAAPSAMPAPPSVTPAQKMILGAAAVGSLAIWIGLGAMIKADSAHW